MPSDKGPIPITKKRSHKKKYCSGKPEPVPDLELPENLTRKVTPTALAKGTYQRKLLALFAPVIMPDLLNSIRRNLKLGDSQAQKLAAEVLGLTHKAPAVSLNLNQNNAQVNVRGGSADTDKSIGSFEDIARIIQDKRRNAIAGPGTQMIEPVFSATPEE